VLVFYCIIIYIKKTNNNNNINVHRLVHILCVLHIFLNILETRITYFDVNFFFFFENRHFFNKIHMLSQRTPNPPRP